MIAIIFIITTLLALLVATVLHSYLIRKNTVLYQINKGRHFSIRPLDDLIKIPFKPGIHRGSTLYFDFLFSAGTNYDPLYDRSVHKLYGICFGFDPKYRSIRIGWRSAGGGDIQLYSFVHENGVMKITYLYTVKTFNTYTGVIKRLNDTTCSVEVWSGGNMLAQRDAVVSSVSDSLKFKLYPYYGGKLVAQNTVKIYITEK